MIKIIKKDGKYFRQQAEETQITLEELENESSSLAKEKEARVDEQSKMYDDRIVEVKNLIAQIKAL